MVAHAASGAWRAARRAGRVALDLLLPPQCIACDEAVADPGTFCASCAAAAGFIATPCCDACGLGLGSRGADGGAGRCGACAMAPPPWARARAAMRYDGVAKRVVLPLKYADRVELAPALAALMVRAGGALLRDADMLVPVPLHRARLRARRYNQAALLARAVGRLTGVPVAVDALTRVRATAPLGELSAADRLRAVSGVFAVRPGAVLAGHRVLLVDDVLTSGATARGCTSALLAGGARGVDVLVAARVGRAWPGGGDDGRTAGGNG